ncbi:MAG: heme NO-binding domain-containing protein [Polyangiaceae bacterium]|nr:heme NO-binding domain-containing protein [Polyangiaceae bacterium]
MKGIIFNVLELFVEQEVSPGAFDEALEEVELISDGIFVGPKTYPDEDLLALVGYFSEKLSIEPFPLVRAFGRFALPHLAARFPNFVEGHTHPKTFLLTVHGVIHVEVRKLMEKTKLPDFSYEDPAPNQLIMYYRSERKLCALAEGLILGTGDFFETPISIDHSECMHRGADACKLELVFEDGGPSRI